LRKSTNGCLKACGVALSSAVMSNIEYQACKDHCVADFIKCKRWLLKDTSLRQL
jgi:hypothetical protein